MTLHKLKITLSAFSRRWHFWLSTLAWEPLYSNGATSGVPFSLAVKFSPPRPQRWLLLSGYYLGCWLRRHKEHFHKSFNFVSDSPNLFITLKRFLWHQEDCQMMCFNSSSCHGFTHFNDNAQPHANYCETFSSPSSPIPCENCISGPKACTCSGKETP